jgi:hypothetical protein
MEHLLLFRKTLYKENSYKITYTKITYPEAYKKGVCINIRIALAIIYYIAAYYTL